jgi:hypothetical protein
MRAFWYKLCILGVMLLGLPLLGITLKEYPVSQYLEFPPRTRYVSHAGFSWTVFLGFLLLILAGAAPLFVKAVKVWLQTKGVRSRSHPFPWWGTLGLVTGATAWVLAWTRFSWASALQPHTFTPLWLSYILVINALTYRRDGHCMMLNRPGFFLLLFPASTVFWWFFEYLNRFVQNWYYVGADFGPWAYLGYASLSFSTVLPAVLGTREWIAGSPWLRKGFGDLRSIRFSRPRLWAAAVLAAAGAGLFGLGIWPNWLFPLLWVSPLLIIVSLQAWLGEAHVLKDVARGDWRLVVSSAFAALFCGGLWEMWNYYSLAKWEYAIPFVHRYSLFEMPILGYGGYLPFGLECAVIGTLLPQAVSKAHPVD